MTHEQLLEKIRTMLEQGVQKRADPFHTPVLATIGLGGEPQLRIVVLRKFLRASNALMCHVDLRSPKTAEINREPRVSWLFYHPQEKLQLRASGIATIHTDDELADKQWQTSQLFSRRCYCGDAPGTLKETPSSGLPAFLEDRQPTEEETETLGRKNFAIVNTTINEIDVYELNVKGHRRSLFVFDENGKLETRWLTP